MLLHWETLSLSSFCRNSFILCVYWRSSKYQFYSLRFSPTENWINLQSSALEVSKLINLQSSVLEVSKLINLQSSALEVSKLINLQSSALEVSKLINLQSTALEVSKLIITPPGQYSHLWQILPKVLSPFPQTDFVKFPICMLIFYTILINLNIIKFPLLSNTLTTFKEWWWCVTHNYWI
jgi:hypothetical protein